MFKLTSFKVLAASLAMVLVAGCSIFERDNTLGIGNLWGLSDDARPEHRAYALQSRYVYYAIPLVKYQNDPEGQGDIKQVVCEADPYDAIMSAADAVRAGGDRVSTGLVALSSALESVSASINPASSVELTVKSKDRIVTVVSRAASAIFSMRVWRVKTADKISSWIAKDQLPTSEDWSNLDKETTVWHERIQSACDDS